MEELTREEQIRIAALKAAVKFVVDVHAEKFSTPKQSEDDAVIAIAKKFESYIKGEI